MARLRDSWRRNLTASLDLGNPAPESISRSPYHMSLAFFKKEYVTIRGATASYASTADSGNINTRHFCPTCGSRVYGENSGRPGIIGITVGCLDKNDWFSAQAVVYTKGLSLIHISEPTR